MMDRPTQRQKMSYQDLEIREYQHSDEGVVVRLWKECNLVVSWNNPHSDIKRKLRVQPELFLVGLIDGRIVATVMAGYEGHRGWINYLAVAPELRRTGIGRRIMEEVENRLKAIGCPKINLQVRTTNTDVIEFYKNIGFSMNNVASMGKRIEFDT
jgi:ribosomal protein S18 acetylase RimI-like enzyme